MCSVTHTLQFRTCKSRAQTDLMGHDLICWQTEIIEEMRVHFLPPTYWWMPGCPFDREAKTTGVPRPMGLDIALSLICFCEDMERSALAEWKDAKTLQGTRAVIGHQDGQELDMEVKIKMHFAVCH